MTFLKRIVNMSDGILHVTVCVPYISVAIPEYRECQVYFCCIVCMLLWCINMGLGQFIFYLVLCLKDNESV